jgi:hypothetical protein
MILFSNSVFKQQNGLFFNRLKLYKFANSVSFVCTVLTACSELTDFGASGQRAILNFTPRGELGPQG